MPKCLKSWNILFKSQKIYIKHHFILGRDRDKGELNRGLVDWLKYFSLCSLDSYLHFWCLFVFPQHFQQEFINFSISKFKKKLTCFKSMILLSFTSTQDVFRIEAIWRLVWWCLCEPDLSHAGMWQHWRQAANSGNTGKVRSDGDRAWGVEDGHCHRCMDTAAIRCCQNRQIVNSMLNVKT